MPFDGSVNPVSPFPVALCARCEKVCVCVVWSLLALGVGAFKSVLFNRPWLSLFFSLPLPSARENGHLRSQIIGKLIYSLAQLTLHERDHGGNCEAAKKKKGRGKEEKGRKRNSGGRVRSGTGTSVRERGRENRERQRGEKRRARVSSRIPEYSRK